MIKPVLAIDIDEVLFPFTDLFLAYHNEKHGTNIALSDMQTNYLEDITGDTLEQILVKLEDFANTEAFRQNRPLQHSVESLEKLRQHYELVLVTARDHFYRGHTERFIEGHYPNVFRELHYTHQIETPHEREKKWVMCQRLNAVALIDDTLKNVVQCAEHGIDGIVFGDYPWNQADELPPGVTRCKDWPAVLEYFGRQRNA